MLIERKVNNVFEEWRFDDATVEMPIEDLQHIDYILRNDPVMADYCSRCAESGMWKLYDAFRDSVFKAMQVSAAGVAVGFGLTYIFKLSHNLHLL